MAMGCCLVCGAASEVGTLCRGCAQEVPPCEGLIQDHLRSTVVPVDAEAWLVDGFGVAHPVAAKATIGRNLDGQIVALEASVSRAHAEFKQSDAGWYVRDLRSRNGTMVDGVKIEGKVMLKGRTIVKVGDVAMWFLTEVAEEPAAPPTMETASAGGGLVRYALSAVTEGASELCLIGSQDDKAGGALLSRAKGALEWKSERALPPLEFQLLRALCARACAEADSPAVARGCVATKQLARELPFQSKYANEENVRQVVRRLRSALAEVGAEGALAVVPGRGYYLACPVTISSTDRR